MTLQASGIIWASQIGGEFSPGVTPWYISNHYRGGPYVPNISQNNSIPTSGLIYFSNFYGTTKASLSISPSPANAYNFQAEPAPSSKVLSVGVTASGAGVTSGSWAKISGAAGTTINSSTSLTPTFSATVNKNNEQVSVWRFTANNGLTADVTVSLKYETDA
ncbi:MAG TPA: hypothetical protein VGD46_05075 [Rhizobacter sp.]